ncbi:MAG: TonB-dependent receptor, partial [Myxococcales bacterium]|nr:TonB-dependent receptor [Myxococcales bacterium]
MSAPRLVGSTLAALGERRASAAVAEIIGAEQMRRAGDSDAAGALKRATGVTVQDGRFVYIRGLGPRYTGTLLNGSELPSPEPDRRVVPLDMFPAGLLESVSIQKTYSAELPGGFGGGMVKIRTRPFPGELEASVSLSGSARTRTTFLEGPMSAGGAWDWLGVDGGARALPDSVQAASSRAPLLETDMFSSNGYTAAELERFGEAMQPRGGWAAKRRVVPPGVGLGGDLGDSVDFDGGRFGFLAALGYDSDWQHERYNEKFCDRSGCNASYDFEQLEMRVTTSGILSLGLDLGDAHELRWTTFVNHIGSDEVRGYEGYNDDVQTDVRVDRQRFVEQTLLFDQLRGKHVLAGVAPAGDAVLEWRYALSTAWRSEPDRRQTRYDYDPGLDAWLLADRPDGNSRVSSNLSDVAHDVGVDTSWPLVAGEDGEEDALAITLKAGAAFAYKDREVDTRRYRMSHKGALATDAAILARSPDAIFVPENIGVDGFQLAEVTLPTDNYTGTQTVVGVYALGELALGERLTVQAGARVEASSQRLSTFEPFNPDGAPLGADLSTLDVLPSLNASWQVAEGHALRLGVARTVTRPDFRELSPATFNDVTGGKQSFGNPDLDRTLITHVDARWDWYPSDGELISVGAFWKRFEDPIEQVLIPSAQLSQSWDNVPEANNLGLELEVRLGLGFLGDVFEDLELAGNFAWIHSRVSLAGLDTIQTSKDRALEGQAPYVVNLELAYDDEESGTSAALLYNTTGAYITEVGAQGRGEEVQAPRHVIDLVFGQKLGEGWSFKVKARNLLDSPSVRRIPDWEGGGLDVKRVSLGRELSVGIS